MVAQAVDIAQCVAQSERKIAQRTGALLDPAVRSLDAHVRYRLSGIERNLSEARARPPRSAAVQAGHAPVAVQVENVVAG